jgi:hypothetical protein
LCVKYKYHSQRAGSFARDQQEEKTMGEGMTDAERNAALETAGDVPITMNNAFVFGWKAGWGFICAQVVLGALAGFVWFFVHLATHKM